MPNRLMAMVDDDVRKQLEEMQAQGLQGPQPPMRQQPGPTSYQDAAGLADRLAVLQRTSPDGPQSPILSQLRQRPAYSQTPAQSPIQLQQPPDADIGDLRAWLTQQQPGNNVLTGDSRADASDTPVSPIAAATQAGPARTVNGAPPQMPQVYNGPDQNPSQSQLLQMMKQVMNRGMTNFSPDGPQYNAPVRTNEGGVIPSGAQQQALADETQSRQYAANAQMAANLPHFLGAQGQMESAQAAMAQARGSDEKEAMNLYRQLVLRNPDKYPPEQIESAYAAKVKAAYPGLRNLDQLLSLIGGESAAGGPASGAGGGAPPRKNPLNPTNEPYIPPDTLDQFKLGLAGSLDNSLAKQLNVYGDRLAAYPQGNSQIIQALAQKYGMSPEALNNSLMDQAMSGMMLGGQNVQHVPFKYGGATLAPVQGTGGYELTLPTGQSRQVIPRGASKILGIGSKLPILSSMNPLRSDAEKQRILNEEVSPILRLLSGSQSR